MKLTLSILPGWLVASAQDCARLLICLLILSMAISFPSDALAQTAQGGENAFAILPPDRAADEPAPIRVAPQAGTGTFLVMLKTSVEGSQYELDLQIPREERAVLVAQLVRQILEDAGVPAPEGRQDDWLLVGGVDGFLYPKNMPALQRISLDTCVHVIEEDVVVSLQQTAAQSPLKTQQLSPDFWGLDRIDQRKPSLDGRFTYATASTELYAYIIDSGVREDHKEFEGRAKNVRNYVDNDPNDCMGHGTHVAAILAGKSTGVAKTAWIRAYKVFGCSGSTDQSKILKALNDVMADARLPGVVNMSLSSATLNETAVRSVRNLHRTGLIVVAAAGNDRGYDACKKWPSGVADAITVGASNQKDRVTGFSNVGPCVDLFAPGEDILSASHKGQNRMVQLRGTSMATPYAAGVALLVAGQNPGIQPSEVLEHLITMSTENALTRVPRGTPNRLLHYKPAAVEPPTPVEAAKLSAKMSNAQKVFASVPNKSFPSYNLPVFCASDPIDVDMSMSSGLQGYSIGVVETDPNVAHEYPKIGNWVCADCGVPDKLDLRSLTGAKFENGLIYLVEMTAEAKPGAPVVGNLKLRPVLEFGVCDCDSDGNFLGENYCTQ